MTPYDKELYDAWLEGFGFGQECGREDDYPVKWILRAEYWAWRARRRLEARR